MIYTALNLLAAAISVWLLFGTLAIRKGTR